MADRSVCICRKILETDIIKKEAFMVSFCLEREDLNHWPLARIDLRIAGLQSQFFHRKFFRGFAYKIFPGRIGRMLLNKGIQ